MIEDKILIDELDAAKFIGVTPRTLRLWRRKRGVPHYKVTGKVVRYTREDLMQWIGKSRVAMI